MSYDCIGICTPEPKSGTCMGCGRPLQEPAGSQSAAPAGQDIAGTTPAGAVPPVPAAPSK